MTTTTQRVLALLKSIETGEAEAVSVINPSHYTQHNLSAADGLAAFGALLQALPQGSARVNTLRVFRHRPDDAGSRNPGMRSLIDRGQRSM